MACCEVVGFQPELNGNHTFLAYAQSHRHLMRCLKPGLEIKLLK